MIHQISGAGRRVLTFPAVHPCESISPSTLLYSLIELAQSICSFKSRFFSANKRNAHGTIRQVQNVLIVLEEFRVELSDVPDSLVLVFSELHLAFQKIHFLLEDCTREGARLWMLMKSDRVANQFRILIRAISTGLDVLPLEAVGLSSEAKELVELAMRQARKARFEVDPDDKRVINDVTRILGRFVDGDDPDRNEIQQFLDYLGVTKWSECNKEIKFLDTEIGMEYLNVEKRGELSILSSLMGLLTYCRCVIFDHVDTEATHHVNNWCTKMLTGVNPDDFMCPISLEIMKDPVTLSSGHTYDRASILKWFRAGNSTCPKTGERLPNKDLVSNLALKRIIQDWSAENGVCIGEESSHKNRDITRTVLAGSMAAEGAVKLLANFLACKLLDGTSEEKKKAAYEIRLLTKATIFNRSCLVEVGSIPSLLNLLSSKDSSTQENAIAALLNLSKHHKSKSIIVENGGLELIIDVLKKGLKVEARNHAAATLFYIASIEEYRKLIGVNPEAIPALVEMVRNGSNRGKKNALVAIFGLLMHPGNHSKVLAAGIVPLLVDLLSSSHIEELVTDSLAVLATLAEKLEGTLAIIRHGALNVIVRILDSSSSRVGKEYSVSLLLALCINGGAYVVALLVKSPSLMGSLYSVLSEGTSRASKKASALIGVLHEFSESSSGSMVPDFPQERPVHVW
ncbi:U-box domain-containing protein 18-like [Mangifera indica]|uniref:U-box domain-containing protein 18-like n=1 Tax=Mangifera indica TaxID=29780 RepID=UPI001CFA7B5B|nr:U-box domain-containing protein 18-like [Mangifera indica]